jgi:hypothetical protein
MGGLQNGIQIYDGDDDNNCYFIAFDPESQQNILSNAELDQKLRRAFDAPQDNADLEKLEIYRMFPENVPSFKDLPRKSAETIAKDAREFATYTLSDTEWEASQNERDYLARGLRLVLNFSRLISCLQEAEEAYRDGDTDYNILCSIEQAHTKDRTRDLMDMMFRLVRKSH